MAEVQTIEIKKAKGRPMLTWVGKRPLRHVTAFPAQHIESFSVGEIDTNPEVWKEWPDSYPKGGLLFHGDNKEVLAHLLANGYRGKVNLIYIDPPFDSGADYVRKVSLRGIAGYTNIDGEDYTLGEQIQYTDIWANDNYLQFLYERIILLRELLADEGSFWIHLDYRRSQHVRLVLDEVFGPDNFVNEIIWHYRTFQGQIKNYFARKHDTLYLYKKGDKFNFHQQFATDLEDTIDYERWGDYIDEEGNILGGNMPVQDSRFRRYLNKWIEENGREPDEDEIVYQMKGQAIDSVWDIKGINPNAKERTDYPTQKPEPLLERIISTSSNKGDIVFDCFIGSGTTAAVAQSLGRRWIGCDINKGAIQTTTNRLQTIIQEQQETFHNDQAKLPNFAEDCNLLHPTQYSFAVYRVNDYDLQIQHNEAVELACEHIGIQRIPSDAFFDGTHGKKIAKIVPFNHPCTLLDLEEIKIELQSRPEEERDITVVCLGKEAAVDSWLEDWNKMRQRGDVPNKIEVIELRTDPRYGKFFIHQPASAKVNVQRENGKIKVTIEDFISPSIIERLKDQSGILAPQIDDWRSMVDTVMIDPSYNGEVFNIAIADVPERKNDLVVGEYELDAQEEETMVAVKITDMLGEEVLVTNVV